MIAKMGRPHAVNLSNLVAIGQSAGSIADPALSPKEASATLPAAQSSYTPHLYTHPPPKSRALPTVA